MRKVSEALYAGVDEVYRAHGVDLSSRSFPILFLLRDRGRLGISEIAAGLGQTHPAISQMSRKLLAHGVIQEWADPGDERRRLLGLSRRGAQMMKRLVPVWAAIAAAAQELDDAHPVSNSLTAIDHALAGTAFAVRIQSHLKKSPA